MTYTKELKNRNLKEYKSVKKNTKNRKYKKSK